MMHDSYLKVFNVVCNVPQNRDTHDKEVELNLLHLLLRLIRWRSLKDSLNFLLLLLLLRQLFCDLLFGLPVFETLTDLP